MPISTYNLMTVGEMIEAAFGNFDTNTVNFKLMQTILVLLARQIRLLDRKVSLDMKVSTPTSTSNIVVSELKLKELATAGADRAGTSEMGKQSDTATPHKRRVTLTKSITDLTHMVPGEGTSSNRPKAKSEIALPDKKYKKLLETIEEQREQVLRVIQQRKSSREEGVLTPAPMASLNPKEMELEKIFMIKNLPDEKGKSSKTHPFVTQSEFSKLIEMVLEMKDRIEGDYSFRSPSFPENMKLMQDLRKGASLTEAMAALQISTRLGAVEKAMQKISSLVTDIAQGNQQAKIQITTLKAKSSAAEKSEASDEKPMKPHLYVTKEDFQCALEDKQKEIMSRVNSMMKRTNAEIENNTSQARVLEMKLTDLVNMQNKLGEIETIMDTYTEQLRILDNGLSSQVLNVQEQLQYVILDLDAGLENMNETLANKGVDIEIIWELNSKFKTLQADVEKSNMMQKELNEIQNMFTVDIKKLKYDVELLRDIKCDRDEVIDALRDKAGLKDLNGMVTTAQHTAAYGDFEKKINRSYETFRFQELTWQKAIDDLYKSIDGKVELIHMETLRSDINDHLNKLKRQIHSIETILGEPLAAGVSRKIYRDAKCLSCSNPAHIKPPDNTTPLLPPLRPSAIGAEMQKRNGDGDYIDKCIQGIKVVHPVDPSRGEMCTRYCGGTHTKILPTAVCRKLSDFNVKGEPMLKPKLIDAIGEDGKMYKVEEDIVQKPCIPCNQQKQISAKGSLQGLEKKNKSLEFPFRSSFTTSVPPMDQLSLMDWY